MVDVTGGIEGFVASLLFWLGTVVATALFCSLVGRFLASRHRRFLQVRLAELTSVTATTHQKPRFKSPVHSAELVTGSAVFAVDYLQQLLALIRLLVGGRIPAYERLIRTTRDEALVRLRERAQARGAEMVINVRFETSRVSLWTNPGCIEILAFGTAVAFSESTTRPNRFLRQGGSV